MPRPVTRRITETVTGPKLSCTRCKHPQPVNSFTTDNRTLTGRGSVCRICREKKRKTIVCDPDWDVIAVGREKIPGRRGQSKTYAHGSWDRIARHAQLLNHNEQIRVSVESGYQSHHSACVAVYKAAKRIGVGVVVTHGKREIYVRPASNAANEKAGPRGPAK
jgi:hypothetical protein